MSQHFPKLYQPFGGNINVKVDLSNYATKDDIKNITLADTSSFALKTNLSNLKTEVDELDINELRSLSNNLSILRTKVDKLDIDKLAPVPTDLSKLSDVVKNEVVKKTEYDAKIKNIEDKIPDISNLATKSNLNTRINEVKNEIPSITDLATTYALTAVKNKIPSISNLVKKTDYDTKIGEIENRMISLNRKIVSNKTKDITIENELKKLKTFDLSYFRGKNYHIRQSKLLYISANSKYLKVAYVNDITYILSLKSRGLNDVKIDYIKTNNYLLNPRMDHYDMSKIRIKFDGSFLNRFPPTILYGNIVNIYIVYEITSDYKDIIYPTLEHSLFQSAKSTKNADIDKYRYSGYGVGFDRETSFSIGNEIGKNVIIFGVDMSSSTKIDNRKKDILILGKGPTQGLEHTLCEEKCIQLTLLKKYKILFKSAL